GGLFFLFCFCRVTYLVFVFFFFLGLHVSRSSVQDSLSCYILEVNRLLTILFVNLPDSFTNKVCTSLLRRQKKHLKK
ncbi:hypothetical protein F5887DRAFT_1100232, partial [Amanita rubescens]